MARALKQARWAQPRLNRRRFLALAAAAYLATSPVLGVTNNVGPVYPKNNLGDLDDPGAGRGNLSATAYAADRTALAAMTKQGVVQLMEAGRQGAFAWSSSNLSASVTLDTVQAFYVPPASDTSGASGAWVRIFSGAADHQWGGATTALSNCGAIDTTMLATYPSLYIPYVAAGFKYTSTVAIPANGSVIGDAQRSLLVHNGSADLFSFANQSSIQNIYVNAAGNSAGFTFAAATTSLGVSQCLIRNIYTEHSKGGVKDANGAGALVTLKLEDVEFNLHEGRGVWMRDGFAFIEHTNVYVGSSLTTNNNTAYEYNNTQGMMFNNTETGGGGTGAQIGQNGWVFGNTCGAFKAWRIFCDTLGGTGLILAGSHYGSITAAGSGYSAPAIYQNVTMTGGSGAGAKATIQVSGGAVVGVTITTAGVGYAAADVLSCAAASIGGGGSGFQWTISSVSTGLTYCEVSDSSFGLCNNGQLLITGSNTRMGFSNCYFSGRTGLGGSLTVDNIAITSVLTTGCDFTGCRNYDATGYAINSTGNGVTWVGGQIRTAVKAGVKTNTGVISTGSITAAGSGYVNGSYTNVPLTGGTGADATANITVAGGAVTVVTIKSNGTGYTAADVLSASNTNLGGSGSGFTWTVSTVVGSVITVTSAQIIGNNTGSGTFANYDLARSLDQLEICRLNSGGFFTGAGPATG